MNMQYYWKAKHAPALSKPQVTRPGPALMHNTLHIHSFVPLTSHAHEQMLWPQTELILDHTNSRQSPDPCKHMAQASLKQQVRQRVL